jgi:hypothetical protein
MKKAMEWWHDALEDWTEEDATENWKHDNRIFTSFYFSLPGRDKLNKMKQIIYYNNLRIITGNYKNKEVDKLRIKHEQEIKRMYEKIKELNLKNYSINSALLFDNKYFKTRLYHRGKEIIY